MSRVRASLAAGVLCAGSLLVPAPQPARACSPLPALSLQPVAHSQAGGSIVLLARCLAGATCPALSALRVERVGAAGALPGTVEVKAIADSTDQLVFFRPEAPLEAGGTYMARIGSFGVSVPLAAPGVAAPLERVRSEMTSRVDPAGQAYSCDAPSPGAACGLSGGLSWHERAVVQPTLSVVVPGNEGWLFRTYQGSPPRGGFTWGNYANARIELSPDVESCLVVEGWHVVSDTHETRSVCATGPRLSEAERNKTVPTPSLASCTRPPVRSDTRQEASELLETFCRDRRAYCAWPPTWERMGCAPLDLRCAELVPEAVATADAGVQALAATEDASGAPRAANEEDDEVMPAEANGDGCALGRQGGHAWAFALLLFVHAWRRQRGVE